MKYKFVWFGIVLILGIAVLISGGQTATAQTEASLSADGRTLYNGVPRLILVADPNPEMQGIKIPAPEMDKILANTEAASATFAITYLNAGQSDAFGQPCVTFPENAKAAFNAAAAIWANTLESSVPITIRACWASLSNPNVLGYSGGQPLHRDFSGAPLSSTWYQASLANSLAGSDLEPTSFDMHITYNTNFAWYYGTDANPPAGTYDLVTVAAHEIGHGLNFSGSAYYDGGTGSYGYSFDPNNYPNVYDTFMEDGAGTKLTSYANPSTSLGSLLTSGNLWFDGTNANAANGGRVRMYAPSTWASGSSYSHLDYDTFAGSINSMMVFAIGAGSANHNPGPVTTGLLNDLGWQLPSTEVPPAAPVLAHISNPDGDGSYTVDWNDVNTATSYMLEEDDNSSFTSPTIYTETVSMRAFSGKADGTWYYRVLATNEYGDSNWSNTVSAYVGPLRYIYLPLVLKNYASPNTQGPTPGYWESAYEEFYVTPDSGFVDKFAIYISVDGCGNYKITHLSPVPAIVSNQFSYDGAFYFSGIFTSSTTASGIDGLNSFDLYGCGTISGGPWSWDAIWVNDSQPTLLEAELVVPELIERVPDFTKTHEVIKLEP